MANDYLAHYGVLGMRWGVRKNRDTLFNRTSSRRTRGLQYRLNKDNAREAKGKRRKYDTDRLTRDLEQSKAKDKAVQDRVMKLSKGKLAAQTILMGSRGALRYNQARTSGYGRLVSYGASIVGRLRLDDIPIVNVGAGVVTKSKYRKG